MRNFRILVFALMCLSAPLLRATNARPMPFVKSQFFDSNGVPCAGCLIYIYQAGTPTPLVHYTDSNGSSASTNPVTLDSAGRADIFIGPVAYKFVLKTASGSTIWTEDNIRPELLLETNGTANGSQGTLNIAQGANIAVSDGGTGTVTISSPKWANIRDASTFAGSDCGAKINAADADLSSAYGEIWVDQSCGMTWTTTVVLSTGHVLRFVQGGSYTAGSGTIEIPSKGGLVGPTMGNVTLIYTGSGDFLSINTKDHAIIRGISVTLANNGPAVGLHLQSSTPQYCEMNHIEQFEVGSTYATSLTAVTGQVGIKMDGDSCVFNTFRDIQLNSMDQPVVIAGTSEGNRWYDLAIHAWGHVNGNIGIAAGGNDDQFYGVKCNNGFGFTGYCAWLSGDVNFLQGNNDGKNVASYVVGGDGVENLAVITGIGVGGPGTLTGSNSMVISSTTQGPPIVLANNSWLTTQAIDGTLTSLLGMNASNNMYLGFYNVGISSDLDLRSSGTGGVINFVPNNVTEAHLQPGGLWRVGSMLVSPGDIDVTTPAQFGPFGVFGDNTNACNGAQQLGIFGASNTLQQLLMGYNTTTDVACIQAQKQGISFSPILINPLGGPVGVGSTTVPKGVMGIYGLPAYANNTLALAGGLAAGDLYRTGGDPDVVAVVH